MKDSVLHQFTARSSPNPVLQEQDGEGTDDCGSFGWLRGMRERALFLELRKKDGSVTALGYPWLERVDFEDGITLQFSGQVVKIAGRNLNAEVRPGVRLLNGLLRHKIPWIQEADEPTAMAADKDAAVIEAIVL